MKNSRTSPDLQYLRCALITRWTNVKPTLINVLCLLGMWRLRKNTIHHSGSYQRHKRQCTIVGLMLANRLRRWSTIKRTYRCNPSCCQVLFPDGHLSKRGRLVLVVWTSPVAKVMENCRVVPRMGMNIWGSLVQVPSGTSTCRRMQKAVAVNTRLLRAKSKDCNYFGMNTEHYKVLLKLFDKSRA